MPFPNLTKSQSIALDLASWGLNAGQISKYTGQPVFISLETLKSVREKLNANTTEEAVNKYTLWLNGEEWETVDSLDMKQGLLWIDSAELEAFDNEEYRRTAEPALAGTD